MWRQRSKYWESKGNRRGTHGPPVPQIWCNSDYYLQSYGILKRNGTRHVSLIGRHLESVSRTILIFKDTLAPSEKWPTQEISVPFGPFCYRVIVLTLQSKGQSSHKAKNRRKHFRGKIGRAISNLVAVLVSDLWAMAGKNGTVFFQQLAAILNVPFRPNWLLNLS